MNSAFSQVLRELRRNNINAELTTSNQDELTFPIANTSEVINFPFNSNWIMTIRMNDISVININSTERRDAIANIVFEDNFEQIQQQGSDVADIYEIVINNNIDNPRIVYVRQGIGNTNRQGAFFAYINKTKLNLRRYQIYNDEKQLLKEDKNCLIFALEKVLNEQQMEKVYTIIKTNQTPLTDVEKIAKELQIIIKISHLKENGIKCITYPKKKGINSQEVKLILFRDHYMLNESIEVSSYALTNYTKVKDEKNWNTIVSIKNGKIERNSSKSKISLLKVLQLMTKNNHFEPMKISNTMMKTLNYNKIFQEIDNLEYQESTIRKYEYKPKDNIKFSKIYFADFETHLDKDKLHRADTISIIELDSETPMAHINKSEKKLVESVLKILPDNSLIYFHNLGFDFKCLINHVSLIKIIDKSRSKITFAEVAYDKKKFYLKDTLGLFGVPLSKLPSMFGIKGIKKEIISHKLYKTTTDIEKPYINYKTFIKPFQEELEEGIIQQEEYESKIKQINENLDEWDCRRGQNQVLHKKYRLEYCKMDTIVLNKSFEKFREAVFDICERLDIPSIDILNTYTLPSLAFEICKAYGCLDNCFEISGKVRWFCQKALVGGRTMCCENKKIKVKNDIANMDANSLYPSALVLQGFAQGIPKAFYKELPDRYDYAIFEVNITEIPNKLKFPLLSNVNKDGVRMFENKTGIYTMTNIDLEELKKYQDIKYEIIKGYYWDEGYNNKICELVNILFSLRQEYKSKGNKSMEQTIKLIMNSIYGKLLQKPIDKKSKPVKSTDILKYFSKNHYKINKYYKLNEWQYITDENCKIDDDFNFCHLGVQVLSNSKKIMNEVMCLAEQLEIKMYYQDTDSIHMDKKELTKLITEFAKKTGKVLVGKNLGQFSSDFDKSVKDIANNFEPYAVEAIYLGKKSYIEKILHSESEYDYHLRLKGIPEKAITQLIKDKFNKKPMDLFEDFYKGNDNEFDLMESCGFIKALDLSRNSEYIDFKRKLVF